MRIARRGLTFFVVFVLLLTALPAGTILAWKPYTHNYTGDLAFDDVADDGQVTVNGRAYSVRPELVAALRAPGNRAFYNAGVVGPDGFPDLTYGQAVIHPVSTGTWLKYLYQKAWEAQTDPYYGDAERKQILAFMYGYLTHAAGDMFAHTLVNDMSGGVFPEFKDILLGDKPGAEIAIRHLIVEGYIGHATPGFDDDDERGPAPGGDISDDNTHGIAFAAPHRFLYRALVDPAARTPLCLNGLDDDHDGVVNDGCPNGPPAVGTSEATRGPLIDFFLTLRASLASFVEGNPDPVGAALGKYNETKASLDKVADDCDFDDIGDVLACPAALLELGFNVVVDSAEAFAAFVTQALYAAAKVVLNAYVKAWIDDIDEGLEHWSELGLASTKALFDPQARRDVQNEECQFKGGESTQARADCEDAIGVVDVLLETSDDFINDHLLSMLGAPDFVGGLREVLGQVSDLLAPLHLLLNPITVPLAAIKEFAKDLILDLIEEAYGIDLEALKEFISHPTHWLNVESAQVTLPVLGTVSLTLFTQGQHARLDQLMGLPPDHHVQGNIPVGGTRLADGAEFNPETFAPLKNTVTMAKLLLLDGSELNRALGDLLVAGGQIPDRNLVTTYPAGSNIMTESLGGGEPWLRLIDGDHAWRDNRLPRFCATPAECARFAAAYPARPQPTLARPKEENGGRGTFPIWESCLLRPAFRGLYADWENGDQQFPDLFDGVSADPSDPNPPVSTLTPGANIYVSGGTTYIGPNHVFTLAATDQVFQPAQLGLQYRFYKDGAAPGAFQPLANNGKFSIPANGGDGVWHVDYRAADPCHTFGEDDTLAPEATHTATFVLDTTAPVVTYTAPAAGQIFDTDDTSSIAYTSGDGPLGSGVASQPVTLDGKAATNGQVLDMFFLDPGTHTIAVTATDNLGNSGVTKRTFEVHATAESLNNNLDRALSLGLVERQAYNGLKAKLQAALAAHNRGQHATEHNQLGAFVNELEAQRGKKVDVATANRFIAFAKDLIALGR